jgi:hypothetical protein
MDVSKRKPTTEFQAGIRTSPFYLHAMKVAESYCDAGVIQTHQFMTIRCVCIQPAKKLFPLRFNIVSFAIDLKSGSLPSKLELLKSL